MMKNSKNLAYNPDDKQERKHQFWQVEILFSAAAIRWKKTKSATAVNSQK